ncbi:MAG: helix-turn-helix transcriptional regulator [Bacteroidetes bacterium]|nr:helix-turn-helix transcriptional regulator [Bacteroidota bacterium]
MLKLPPPTLPKSGKVFPAKPALKKVGFLAFLLFILLSDFDVELVRPGQNDQLPVVAASAPTWGYLQWFLLAGVFGFGWIACHLYISRMKMSLSKNGILNHRNTPYVPNETVFRYPANGSGALHGSNGHQPAAPELQNGSGLVRKVMEQIHLHADSTDFNVEKLCRKVGMSYTQLHRKVTLLSGKNPNQLIREVRLYRAKELLHDHGIHISEVAFQSGYSDPSYFSRIFTKETGMTPSEFREKC